MKNYWLDRQDLHIVDCHFEFTNDGLTLASDLSNGHVLRSWIDQDGIMNTGRGNAWDEDTDPGLCYMELEFEMQEVLAEQRFGPLVSHNYTDEPEPLEGSFTMFLSGGTCYSPKVNIVDLGEAGVAVKFVSHCRSSVDDALCQPMNMENLVGSKGHLLLTCPAGQIAMENAWLYNRKPVNGYFIFRRPLEVSVQGPARMAAAV